MQLRYKLHPNDPIPTLEGLTVGDFWSWAYSDVLSNRNRAIYAEFLVGAALGTLDRPRIEWDGYDLLYQNKKIEVKASGYLQSWQQTKPTKVCFDIASKRSWDANTNTIAATAGRIADCNVFCLFTETNPEQADVLNVNMWEFYVIPTALLNTALSGQKSVGLNRLRSLCEPTRYEYLKYTVDATISKLP